MPEKAYNPFNFWQELKRRKVFRVIVMYAGAAYVIIELVNNVAEPLHLPGWLPAVVILLLIIGFPIVAILSWIFDITPEGIIKTESSKIAEEPSETIRRKLKVSDAIIAALVVVVCILIYPKIFKKDKFEDIRNADGKISVAVMPFKNLTGDSSLYCWENGISVYLANGLGNSQELAVISSQTVFEILSVQTELSSASLSPSLVRETARKINANTHVTGSYLGSEQNCTLMADLVNTSTGEIIWTSRVEGDLETNYNILLNRLTDTIKNFLEIKALEENVNIDLLNAFPNSSEAYKHYIEGLNDIARNEYRSAISSLKRAYEIDSTFAYAAFYISFAMNYGRIGSVEEDFMWSERAYELKHELPAAYQKWIDLWYALSFHNRGTEILWYCSILEKSDWESRFMWNDLAVTYTDLFRDYKRSIPAFEKVEEINKKWGNDWTFGVYYDRYSLALLMEERLSDAERIINTWLRVRPVNVWTLAKQGALSLLMKDTAAFERHKYEIRKVINDNDFPESTAQYVFGEMYCMAKDTLTATGYFRKVYELEPDRALTLYKLVETQLQCNLNLKECLELSETGIESNPQYSTFYWTKGKTLYKLERYEEGLKFLKQADSLSLAYNKILEDDIKAAEKALAREQ